MNKIHETSRMDEAEITTLPGEDRCVNHHGKTLPLLSLGQTLSAIGTDKSDASEDIVVTVARRHGKFGMSVDAVLGVQKVVSVFETPLRRVSINARWSPERYVVTSKT